MLRYLAFAWDYCNTSHIEAAKELSQRQRQRGSEWQTVFEGHGLVVFCPGADRQPRDVHSLGNSRGVVLGSLFRRHSACTCADAATADSPIPCVLQERDHSDISISRGRRLVDDFWGRYVAFVAGENSSSILKSPVGNLPCFYSRHRGVVILFSYAPDYLWLGRGNVSINWRYLRAYAASGNLCTEGTALSGVHELTGGECLQINRGSIESKYYWHPFSVANAHPMEDSMHAASVLRHEVQSCTNAWASRFPSILHRLSGGLDSSIILSCLTSAPSKSKVTCLTYFTGENHAAERRYARIAASATDCEHVERARDPSIDLGQRFPRLVASVNPTNHLHFLEGSDYEDCLARAVGASAIFDGVGGDYLYGGPKRMVAADYVQRHGIRPTLFRIASHVALRTNKSIWRVLGEAIRDARLVHDWYLPRELKDHFKLVSEDVARDVLQSPRVGHPWFQSMDLAPRGALLMAFSIAVPPPYYDLLRDAADTSAEPVSPLLSQPVVEACLRIPSYVHLDGGQDRGLARRAFASLIPREISQRQWKDRAQGFVDDLLARNVQFAREVLLDGMLVRERILDRKSVEAALALTPGAHAAHPFEVLVHLATETWIRQWTQGQHERVAA